ncbi:hypothetical protein NQZ68_027300 [Dissostichus eleginoides]|nr:hypothetical protein NQZ68_027300 [Dissostichus eleginoides]
MVEQQIDYGLRCHCGKGKLYCSCTNPTPPIPPCSYSPLKAESQQCPLTATDQ